jgi:hypothetical protein
MSRLCQPERPRPALGPVLLLGLTLLSVGPKVQAETGWRTDWRAAQAAAAAGRTDDALGRIEAVLAARPDYPRARLAAARLLAGAGRADEAVTEIEDLLRRGVAVDLAKAPELAALAAHPRHAELAARAAGNAAPFGSAATVAVLSARRGIAEAVVADADGRRFFSDVRERTVWSLAPDGTVSAFACPASALPGCFGLALDSSRGLLWVGTGVVPEMSALPAGTPAFAGAVALDLGTGREVRRISLPAGTEASILGTLRFGPDGALYASDSARPVLWRAAPDADTFEPWLRHPEFLSLQGFAFSADGRTLHLADYGNGLWAVEIGTRTVTRVEPADDACLFGIDDLHAVGDALVGIQNGLAPARIVRIRLRDGRASVEVLARGLPGLDDASTGHLAGRRLEFIAASGWALFADPAATPAPRDVPLLAIDL